METEQKKQASYTAPKVLEHTDVRFETMISGPGNVCTPGFVVKDNMVIWTDCVENFYR